VEHAVWAMPDPLHWAALPRTCVALLPSKQRQLRHRPTYTHQMGADKGTGTVWAALLPGVQGGGRIILIAQAQLVKWHFARPAVLCTAATLVVNTVT
jgi:hypothetical protein